MRKANLGLAAFFIAIGALCLFDAVRLGWRWHPTDGPGAGFLPFYLSLGCIISAALIFWRQYKKEDTGKPLIPPGGLSPILWVLIPSTVMVALVPILGLHISALVYIIFYMKVVGKIEIYKCALIGILFPVSLFIIFDRVFLIPLPSGALSIMERTVGPVWDIIEKLF